MIFSGRGGGGIGFTASSGIREHCKRDSSRELLNVFQGKWRRRPGRVVSPLLEVGVGADGRAGDTHVTCGLRHPSAWSLPPPVFFKVSAGKLLRDGPASCTLTDVDYFNQPCPDCTAHLPGKRPPNLTCATCRCEFLSVWVGVLIHRRPSADVSVWEWQRLLKLHPICTVGKYKVNYSCSYRIVLRVMT